MLSGPIYSDAYTTCRYQFRVASITVQVFVTSQSGRCSQNWNRGRNANKSFAFCTCDANRLWLWSCRHSLKGLSSVLLRGNYVYLISSVISFIRCLVLLLRILLNWVEGHPVPLSSHDVHFGAASFSAQVTDESCFYNANDSSPFLFARMCYLFLFELNCFLNYWSTLTVYLGHGLQKITTFGTASFCSVSLSNS